MSLDERDRKLNRIERLFDMGNDGAIDESFILMEIFRDKLWEVSDDSFNDFLENEFPNIPFHKAIEIVRVVASFDEHSEHIVESLISQNITAIEYQI